MKKNISLIVLIYLLFSSPAIGTELIIAGSAGFYLLDTSSDEVTPITARHRIPGTKVATASDGRIYIDELHIDSRHTIVAEEGPIEIHTLRIIPFAPVRTESGEIEYEREDPVFEHTYHREDWDTEPLRYIYDLAVKNIGAEGHDYRVYFSVVHFRIDTGYLVDGQIYYVDDSGAAQPYYTVPVRLLETPSCPGVGQHWIGDFSFDDEDNLYLSTGNTIPSSLYRVSGAGVDEVTGIPEFLYERAGAAMHDLEFDAPGSLYIHNHSPNIHRLDVTTLTEELIFTHPDGDDIFNLAVLQLPPLFRRFSSSIKQVLHPNPELRIASVAKGNPVFSKRGHEVVIPLRVVIENASTRIAKETFKIGVMASFTNAGEPFSIPFTVYGSKDEHSFWHNRMGAWGKIAILGNATVKSPDGNPLDGRNITLTIRVDSCDGDESMPHYCRVEEIDEKNNTLQLSVILANPSIQE